MTQPKSAFQSQTGGHSNRLAPHEIIALMRRLNYHATQPKIHNVGRAAVAFRVPSMIERWRQNVGSQRLLCPCLSRMNQAGLSLRHQ
ncbi:hypothetical protein PGT21_012064 [Puccinia graminis f. sp. tritici]|uniref:Uncharacterized protein n=1 Tax=Puccinia graminis f. sp. tritici TaxID=56615 RepID=A0A5B0NY39_PUCGR|nr:hypothetical protein PGT21_012064 [Puccinia graminis f. sp. tritici]KAA1093818.1 hypothetical protein PGTUg99_030904 [Puccinia graminis f. sp. tritici]